MSTTDDQIRRLITQRAADWFVTNRGVMTPEQRQSFTDWLKTSPVHVEEYLAIAVVGRDLRKACAVSARSIEALIERARNEDEARVEFLRPVDKPAEGRGSWWGWQLAALALSVVGLLAVGLVSIHFFEGTSPPIPPEAVTDLHYQTGHGQQHTYVLADNSVVHLNTDSDVTIRYSEARRSVHLNAGEALFEVTHESARPFRVTAKSAEITDVGTKFNVRLRDASTVVTVLEGVVEVRSVQVRAGQQVSVADENGPLLPVAVDAGRATAWLHRQISFDREPLGSVAAEFNRYAMKSIEITTPALRNLRVSGIFTTDDTAAFVAFLRSLDDVQVEETATRIVVSERL